MLTKRARTTRTFRKLMVPMTQRYGFSMASARRPRKLHAHLTHCSLTSEPRSRLKCISKQALSAAPGLQYSLFPLLGRSHSTEYTRCLPSGYRPAGSASLSGLVHVKPKMWQSSMPLACLQAA